MINCYYYQLIDAFMASGPKPQQGEWSAYKPPILFQSRVPYFAGSGAVIFMIKRLRLANKRDFLINIIW